MGDSKKSDKLRLDLFLKRSHLVKRRSLASKLCENGWVKLNGRQAPPGKGVRTGDEIEIRFPREKVLIRVDELPKSPARGQSSYTVISTEKVKDDLLEF